MQNWIHSAVAKICQDVDCIGFGPWGNRRRGVAIYSDGQVMATNKLPLFKLNFY